ncbi:hypothetical protein [Aliidongia dinghuensis]|uniref:hypothetical protein n=1 Tax=Aliidongia dinghuensis TaxID=1867774 RepID=UPI00166EF106|nr:hypothetical protein [Aliidongia dinghuensis]
MQRASAGLLAGLLAIVPAASAHAAEARVPVGYAMHQSLPLDRATNGVDGALQILEDARLTPALRRNMWGQTADTDLVLAEKNPLRKSFAKMPLKPAHLRLVDNAGKVVEDQAFEVPLAELDRQQLHDGPATVLLTTDHSIGTGSYAGLETSLWAVVQGELMPEPLPGRKVLVGSLKNAWKIVEEKTPQGAAAKAVQVVACHPNFANPNWAATEEFVVELTTYRFAGGAWQAATNSLTGYWENDGAWPDDFP